MTSFGELFAGLDADPLDDGTTVDSVFCLIKVTDTDGEPGWSIRSGGAGISSEELLGALEGFVTSLRNELASDWD